MNISVCMIVKNEEHNLQKALQSVPQHYEIVVVDTGSVDRTVEVAEHNGAKVYHYAWHDDFAAARNYAASLAQGMYILALDADEVLPQDTEERIRAFVAQYPRSVGSVFIRDRIDGEWARHRMVRFYPNRPEFRFHGTVHEQVYENDQPAAFQSIQIEIVHHGYEQQEYQRKRKEERYLQLYGKHLATDPHDGYMLYQMGKLLASLKRWQHAEPYLREGLRWGEPARLYYPVMLVLLGYVLREQGKSAEAAALLTPYQVSYDDFPDLFFLLGLLAMDAGQMDKIEHYFTEALKIGDTDKYTSVFGVGSYKAAYNLGVYYEVAGNADLASQCYEFAAQYGYEPAIGRLNS